MAAATENFEKFQDNECRMIVVGRTGSGKSSVVNTILGETLCQVSMWAESATSQVKIYSRRRFQKDVRIVDTPGLFNSRPSMTNEKVMRQLASTALLLAPGPHAFLLVLPIGHRFTDEENALIRHLKNVFGDLYLKHTIVVFTRGDELKSKKVKIEAYIEHSPNGLKELLNSTCQRYVVFDNINSEICAKNLLDMVDRMTRQNCSKFYQCKLFREAEQVLVTTETEVVGTMSGNRPISELSKTDVASMIKSIRASRTSLRDEDVKPREDISMDPRNLVPFLSRLVRTLIRSDLSEGRQRGAIERMIASPSMVSILPLLPDEREISNTNA